MVVALTLSHDDARMMAVVIGEKRARTYFTDLFRVNLGGDGQHSVRRKHSKKGQIN